MGNSDSKADNLQEKENEGANIGVSLMEVAEKISGRVHKMTQNIASHCK